MPLILLVPAIAILVGVALGLAIGPKQRLQAAAQHLAGGVIFGAVAVEIVPVMEEQNKWTAIVAGLAVGAGLMLLIRGLRGEEGEASVESAGVRRGVAGFSIGLLVAFAIDLAIDGMLVSFGVAAGNEGGVVLGIGIGVETLFLGLALASSGRGSRVAVMCVGLVLAVLVLAGGVGGWALVGVLQGWWLTAVLSFGTAALVWLVVEELLVEAHEGDGKTLLGSAMFFVGFGATLVM